MAYIPASVHTLLISAPVNKTHKNLKITLLSKTISKQDKVEHVKNNKQETSQENYPWNLGKVGLKAQIVYRAHNSLFLYEF